jgi:uncharacterized membrane protein YjgN (DUF898 family)
MTDILPHPAAMARPASLPPGGRASAATGATRVVATGDDLARLVWRGQLLTILTLGIYRFWYRTDLRRWYWRNTRIDGDSFEYRGTPKELFVGFLIALAVVVPIYLGGAAATLFIAGDQLGNVTTAGLALLALIAQYGAYRSRRFRLTRTVWRGLSFDQTGSPWRYAALSLAWGMATLVTLGLLLPLFRRAIEGMKIRNTAFGSAMGSFSAGAGRLMLLWTPVWLLLMLLLLGTLYFFGAAAMMGPDRQAAGSAVLAGLMLLAVGLGVFGVAWPIYRAAEFRIFAAGTAIGPVTFSSDLGAASLYWIYIRFGLVLAALAMVGGSLGLALLAFSVGTADFGSRPGSFDAPAGRIIAVLAAIYLGGIYVLMSLKELLLNQPFWRRSMESLQVSGLEGIAGVVARAATDESATGEGLGDAIDFGGV